MLYYENPHDISPRWGPLRALAGHSVSGVSPSNMPPSAATPAPVWGRAAATARSLFAGSLRPLDAGLRGKGAFASVGGSSREGVQ